MLVRVLLRSNVGSNRDGSYKSYSTTGSVIETTFSHGQIWPIQHHGIAGTEILGWLSTSHDSRHGATMVMRTSQMVAFHYTTTTRVELTVQVAFVGSSFDVG